MAHMTKVHSSIRSNDFNSFQNLIPTTSSSSDHSEETPEDKYILKELKQFKGYGDSGIFEIVTSYYCFGHNTNLSLLGFNFCSC